MSKYSANSLTALTAAIFSILAQSLFFIPARQSILLGDLNRQQIIVLAALIFLASLANFWTALAWTKRGIKITVHLVDFGLMGILTWLYAKAGLPIEAEIIASLGLAHLFACLPAKETSAQNPSRLLSLYILSLIDIGASLALILAYINSSWATYLAYTFNDVTFLALGIVFAVFSIFNITAIFWPAISRKNFLFNLNAAPWLIWSVFFIIPLQPSSLILSTAIIIAILSSRYIPWDKIILPPQDEIGHRILLIVTAFQFLIVGLLATIFFLEKNIAGLQPYKNVQFLLSRDLAFIISTVISVILVHSIIILNATINGVLNDLASIDLGDPSVIKARKKERRPVSRLERWIDHYIRPFLISNENLRTRFLAQDEQTNSLREQLEFEKHRINQLTLLAELGQQLENRLDQPVAAQLTVSTLARALNCDLVTLLSYEAERREFVMMASAGKYMNLVPPGYRQGINRGIIGRAARMRKTQVVQDTRQDSDYVKVAGQNFRSELIIPLVYHGHLKGVLVADYEKPTAFNNIDISFSEAVVAKLMKAWEQTHYQQRLTHLIQASISLSMLFDPQTAMREIASIARQTLDAKFAFVTLLDQEGNLTRSAHSGYAPKLVQSLSHDPGQDTLMQAALNASRAFRVRDVRKYNEASKIETDHNGLRSMLAIPIRLRRLSIGAILAFGKQGELFFTENDESLASLLSSQAAAAIENTWLYEQLNRTLKTTQLMYQLSFHVIQSEKLIEAAKRIAETAHQLSNAVTTGIVLYTPDLKEIEAEIEVDASGAHPGNRHPTELIQQAIQTGQSIFVSADQVTSKICYPLQTSLRRYGALWQDVFDEHRHDARYGANLQTLSNQAAIALERTLLLVESRKQAQDLEEAYQALETTYDKTLAALMSALDARDRETEGHSVRVGHIATRLGEALDLSEDQLKALDRGSLLHDIGKIGITDTILHKPGPLSPEEWQIMRTHPEIGARIVEGIPFLKDTLPVIRFHQERWDGSGYPIGLSGKDIPALARIFAVADAFDALTSDRPYRTKVSNHEAMEYMHEQSGILFDPEIVTAFEKLIASGKLADLIGGNSQ